MNKKRMINTKFWSDNFIVELNPLDRYLFLYLLTNEHTNISGIYELPLRTMAFETGLDKEMLEKMFNRLEGKIYYIDGWVYLRNFSKHQSFNESVKKGVETAISQVPEEIREKISKIADNGQGGDRVSERVSNLNLNSNLNLDLNPTGLREPTPKEEASEFFSNPSKQEEVIRFLVEKTIPEPVVRREVGKFINHWAEKTGSGKKQRWETEKTFELMRRIAKWFSNYSTWNKQKSKGKEIIGL